MLHVCVCVCACVRVCVCACVRVRVRVCLQETPDSLPLVNRPNLNSTFNKCEVELAFVCYVLV